MAFACKASIIKQGIFTVRSALAFLQKGHELKIFIQILSGIGYALAHGEGCEDGADSESVDMSEQKQCQQCGNRQTGDIEGDFDFRIFYFYDCAQLTRKEVRGDNRQAAAVRQRDAYAD